MREYLVLTGLLILVSQWALQYPLNISYGEIQVVELRQLMLTRTVLEEYKQRLLILITGQFIAGTLRELTVFMVIQIP